MAANVSESAASPTPNLEVLMLGYQQSNPAATTALINALSPGLLRFFSRYAGNHADAEDILQEAWLRIHRIRHKYQPGQPVLPWVYRIARHVRIDYYRKRFRINSHEIVLEIVSPPAQHESRREHDVPPFEELIAGLPASQREVLTMLKVNGFTLEEVASATSSTVGAVKQKAHRAYQELRSMLEQGRLRPPRRKRAA